MSLEFSSSPETAPPPPAQSQPPRAFPALLGRLFWYSGASGLAQLISIAYALLLARWLQPEGYGLLAGCYAAAVISSFLINWGMDTWLLRQASTDAAPLHLAGQVLKIKAMLGVGWAAALWLILTSLRPDFYLPGLLALVLLDTWLDAGLITLSALLNAMQRTHAVSILLAGGRALRLLGAVGLILAGFTGVLPFAAARLAFTALVLAAALLLVRPAFWDPTPRSPSPTAAPPPLSSIWRQSLPYAGSDLLSAIYAQVDVFLLSLLAGKEATGVYAPAVSLVNALITVLVSAYWLFIPHLTRTHQDHPAMLKRQLAQMTAVLVAAGSGVALFVGLFGPMLVDLLLRQSYQASGDLLRALSAVLFFKSISVGCAALLVAVGRQRQRLLPQLISAGANLLLNLWAIPQWGAMGAAWVYVASEVILAAGYAARVVQFFRGNRKG